jgi:hypothetical protein
MGAVSPPLWRKNVSRQIRSVTTSSGEAPSTSQGISYTFIIQTSHLNPSPGRTKRVTHRMQGLLTRSTAILPDKGVSGSIGPRACPGFECDGCSESGPQSSGHEPIPEPRNLQIDLPDHKCYFDDAGILRCGGPTKNQRNLVCGTPL